VPTGFPQLVASFQGKDIEGGVPSTQASVAGGALSVLGSVTAKHVWSTSLSQLDLERSQNEQGATVAAAYPMKEDHT
jgi:hypothetical protein